MSRLLFQTPLFQLVRDDAGKLHLLARGREWRFPDTVEDAVRVMMKRDPDGAKALADLIETYEETSPLFKVEVPEHAGLPPIEPDADPQTERVFRHGVISEKVFNRRGPRF